MKNYSFLLTSAATPGSTCERGRKIARRASRSFMQFIVRQAYNVPAIKNTAHGEQAKNGNFRTQFAFRLAYRHTRTSPEIIWKSTVLVHTRGGGEEVNEKRAIGEEWKKEIHRRNKRGTTSDLPPPLIASLIPELLPMLARLQTAGTLTPSFLFHVRSSALFLFLSLSSSLSYHHLQAKNAHCGSWPGDPWWAISVSALANKASFSPETPEHRYHGSDSTHHALRACRKSCYYSIGPDTWRNVPKRV